MNEPSRASAPQGGDSRWWAWPAALALIVIACGLALWLAPGEVRERMGALMQDLPANLGGHMRLSVLALAAGIAISLPLGIWVSDSKKRAEWVLGIAGVMQTIPSLALLALMVPLLGGQIGFEPAFAAMVLYSLAPILSNTVTGFRGVDPKLVEAGRGIGMAEGGWRFRSKSPTIRWSIKWPMAMPNVLTGIRLATVIVVGSATLATPVGDTTLGNYIFIGLNTRDYLQVVFGCVAAALLAIAFDQLIRLGEHAVRERKRKLGWLVVLGLLLLVAGGLYRPVARAINPPPNPVSLGTHDHTEQHVLAQVFNETLGASGFQVRRRQGMGQPMTFDATCDGKVDVCIEYLGNIWTNVMKKSQTAGREQMLREVRQFLDDEYGVELFGPVGFQNAYAFAMRRADAQAKGITTVEHLKKHAPGWRIAGDMQFFKQAEWQNCKAKYGLRFRDELFMDQTLTYGAVQSGKVDVIVAYTTDGRIDAFDLVTLEDTLGGLPRYDAVILLSKKARGNPALRQALAPLVESIDEKLMTRINKRVDVDGLLPQAAARELLADLRQRGKFGPGAGQ